MRSSDIRDPSPHRDPSLPGDPSSLRDPSSRRFPSFGTVASAPAIWLIKAYQLVLSPMRPQTCRFYPSCSTYALTAVRRFGVIRGSWLAARRLLRCHPWNPGGVDHVPQKDTERMSGHPTRQT